MTIVEQLTEQIEKKNDEIGKTKEAILAATAALEVQENKLADLKNQLQEELVKEEEARKASAESDGEATDDPVNVGAEDIWPKTCPECGGEILKDDKFCCGCGSKVNELVFAPSKPKCPGCGNEIGSDYAFCPKCGLKIK